VLRGGPGFVALHAATSSTDLCPAQNRTRPDVVVLDCHLPGDDGLVLCRRIKRQIPAPAVLLYSDTPVNEMAAVIGVEPSVVSRRINRMISRLKVELPAPG
jgi:DNA-binding response OmpR family regulator